MVGVRAVLGTAMLLWASDALARPITRTEALAAIDHSPTLAAATAQVDEARGNAEQASTVAYNPAVSGSVGAARVFGGGQTFYNFELGVSQAIELGGKRSARARAATAAQEGATSTLEATRNTIRAEVRRAFDLALVAQSRVGVTLENEGAAREFQAAAAERLKLGAATQTEVNVAVANLGRAMAAKRAAERDLLLAKQALGEALGTPGADLDPVGALPLFPPLAGEDQLVAAAFRDRRDLAAIDRVTAARAAEVDVADAQAVPDPELSVSWARDPLDRANAFVFGVRLELPLWNRNQGARRAARANRKRASIEANVFRVGVERDVRISVRRYGAATGAIAAFDQQVVGTLAENLKLARDSLAAGKLGLLDLNNVRRDLVDSQLTYLDSIAEAVEARAALERAVGRSLEGTP